MGNWRIIIEGVGQHHNKGSHENGKWVPDPNDANVQFHKFVDELIKSGKTINVASFECLSLIEYNETRIRNLFNDTVEMMKNEQRKES